MKYTIFFFALFFTLTAHAQRQFNLIAQPGDSTFVLEIKERLDNGYIKTDYYPSSGALDTSQLLQYSFNEAERLQRQKAVQFVRADNADIESRRLIQQSQSVADTLYFDYTARKERGTYEGEYRYVGRDTSYRFSVAANPIGRLVARTETNEVTALRVWSNKEVEFMSLPYTQQANVFFRLEARVNDRLIFYAPDPDGGRQRIVKVQ